MPSTLGVVASSSNGGVLNEAVLWLDATQSSVVGGKLTNLGTGGSALDATFGSTTGTDTNDPLLLSHTGTNYLYLPGVNGNWAATPDIAAYDVLGDVECVCRMAMDDWTPAATRTFLARSTATDPDRSFTFSLKTTGSLSLDWFPTGLAASNLFVNSTVALPATDGTTYWVKFTLDVDNGVGGYDLKFWYAADQATEPSSWTQLGTTITGGAPTSLPNVASGIYLGSQGPGGSNVSAGKFYRAIVRNGIGGTTVFDADFTRGITSGGQTTFTESSANAATVTINRATSGRKAEAVVRPILLFGTDDYLEVANNALVNFAASDSFTVLAVIRQWNTATANSYMQKNGGGSPITGWSTGASRAMAIGDGAIQPASGLFPATIGALSLRAGVRDVGLDQVIGYVNGSPSTAVDTTTGSLSNASPLRIGSEAVASYQDFTLVAAAVFRRALSAAEIASIATYYGAS